ncbi:arylesterase [Rhodobacteraceae bacterium KMS-5]|uniref:Arylesterase n=1 Tax=Tabrizicola oligotrophica TaxID=2710650 RepID=A0A6M0QTV9_9RHOB|nr:arylesterase [Tabrizicola oligotrophica]NEY90879.1 arylesterase [Tabrizicola oligotrophica]
MHLRLPAFRYAAARAFRNAALTLICTISPLLAEPLTLVALGDSLTAGYGLPEGQGLVPQLEGWLKAKGAEVAVINAGVSGDTTAGGLSRLDWSLTPEVDALMVTLGGNDMLRGLPPETARANLAAILEAAKAKGLPVLLIGMQAPGNYGAEYKTAFDAIYPDLATAFGATLYPSFFQGLAGGSLDPAALRPFLQDDGIHPNAEGVARIVADLGPAVQAFLAAPRP